jgi:predicted TIM-barrel fold metal-dependent hydrolase
MIVVSADSHIGPRLVHDLRPYCPADLRDDFDAFSARSDEFKSTLQGFATFLFEHPNIKTAGHHESAARVADYDYDGIAASVIFHTSMNFEPFPFGPLVPGDSTVDRDVRYAGQQIYNRWLADFVSQAPHRHVGLAYLPMWDIDLAMEELTWAADTGLRGVNFPALIDDGITPYNQAVWDPFWALCQDRNMPIVTHVGTTGRTPYTGPEMVALKSMETGSFFSQRQIWFLIFGGVFERFPGLKHVIVETPGAWFPDLARELDGIWNMFESEKHRLQMNRDFYAKVPRKPSEYMASNVFVGASFCSRHEAHRAVEHRYAGNVLWGSDYPHVEGTFVNPDGSGMPSVTRLALRNTFNDVPMDTVSAMVGGTAIDVFGLDRAALQKIADDIGPTREELARPIDAVPAGASLHAFRSGDTAWS